jgi:hypothetical protein
MTIAIALFTWVLLSLGWGALFGPQAQERREELRTQREAARKRRRERVEEV